MVKQVESDVSHNNPVRGLIYEPGSRGDIRVFTLCSMRAGVHFNWISLDLRHVNTLWGHVRILWTRTEISILHSVKSPIQRQLFITKDYVTLCCVTLEPFSSSCYNCLLVKSCFNSC